MSHAGGVLSGILERILGDGIVHADSEIVSLTHQRTMRSRPIEGDGHIRDFERRCLSRCALKPLHLNISLSIPVSRVGRELM
jgi:hypothetical protein